MHLSVKLLEQSYQPSSLYVVATPIGNLVDISIRALSVLEMADVVCAEDTRVTQNLLNIYGIKAKKMVSLREQNEIEMSNKVCYWLSEGKIVAQVSDAGTPGICDPGSRLVRVVREAGYPIYGVPGACAVTSALSIAGINTDQFLFIGFLPPKKGEKACIIDKITKIPTVVVCYEVPHRILSTLDEVGIKIPNRKLFLIREITKTFETVLIGTASELKTILLNDKNQQKGEMVIIFDNFEMTKEKIPEEVRCLADELLEVMPIKKIIALLSNIVTFDKKELYTYLLEKKHTKY
ncbi:MAG: 16S rRNA (cytidine(1402)-2'-O)-methyltransferase [Neisseriaceae bacterium]|nr:MAG: 16S rRNA (cytidine(1402)-2'-O)-methyltransferase [Neisseriaceae bacterium]